MIVPVLLLASLLIFAVLLAVNGVLAVFFLMLATISTLALVLERRESGLRPETTREGESVLAGWARLARDVGLDATGVTIGALILIGAVATIMLLR